MVNWPDMSKIFSHLGLDGLKTPTHRERNIQELVGEYQELCKEISDLYDRLESDPNVVALLERLDVLREEEILLLNDIKEQRILRDAGA